MKQFTIFAIIMTLLMGNSAPAITEDTDSLLNQALSVFTRTNTLNASIRRSQLFKGSVRESACIFRFDRSQGASYMYSSPSKLQIVCKDSKLYSIDPEKKLGFKFDVSQGNAQGQADLDPLNRFFTLFTSGLPFSFTGSIDSLSIFHHNNTRSGKPDISAGIDRSSRMLELLEFFDSDARLTQQVTFTYGKDNLPETIVTKSVVGGQLLTDSLVIKYKNNDRTLSSEYFSIPENVSWSVPR